MWPHVLHIFFQIGLQVERIWWWILQCRSRGRQVHTTELCFHQKLLSMDLIYMGTNEMSVVYPHCSSLKKLVLQYIFLNIDLCQLIQKCPNLEVLVVHTIYCQHVYYRLVLQSAISFYYLSVIYSSTCKLLRVVSFNEKFLM